ncbi:Lcl2p SCDLUD_001728 [Saccharomycodes ludwigii]|uniref:Lcl2p n=1 Tax=Saccharomycodes ludwigii TaxID=36035 RepID=UPI001E8BE7B0|nr:hypothetical protein SCDLUD_001728 [Saccharomycodes ludwigii]KAH3901943.1 hypothetical protein SCDLUD_001728 [Saccharomycodes ludwigii]
MLKYYPTLLILGLLSLLPFTSAFFEEFFQQGFFQHQQNHQQKQQVSHEESVLNNNECSKYLCPETKACVDKPIDCPCPYPASQLKCILPDNKNYVCISKPAVDDPKLMELYDDLEKGPKQHNEGVRDCGWVIDASKGLV